MLNSKVVKLINEQINKELYSEYLYLAFSCYYSNKSLNGFANWFMVQAQEEHAHAMLFIQYLINNSQEVKLTAIDEPEAVFTDFSQPLASSLKHEQIVTASINNIYAEAIAVKEFRTTQFLDWFVKEQGEEEKNSEDLIAKYALFGQDNKGLYLLDQELGTRVFMPPSLVL